MAAENIHPHKGRILYELHHNRQLLVLPNVWDPLGAALLEKEGYPAIATASASIAYSNGYQDGENIPFRDLLFLLKKITQSVEVPVTADIEKGYADKLPGLVENIKQLLDTGIAGINFEDGHPDGTGLIPTGRQCERIAVIRKTALEMGMPLFINARTDVYLHGGAASAAEKLSETIARGNAYKEAGADCFYPITLRDKKEMLQIIENVPLPVNLLLVPGIPGFTELQEMGVARLSLGPGFLKTAVDAMKKVAEKLLNFDGMDEIIHNPVTSDYLKKLIKH